MVCVLCLVYLYISQVCVNSSCCSLFLFQSVDCMCFRSDYLLLFFTSPSVGTFLWVFHADGNRMIYQHHFSLTLSLSCYLHLYKKSGFFFKIQNIFSIERNEINNVYVFSPFKFR